MICCVTFFYKKKLSKPIKLLTNAYHKIEANDLDFTLSYPLNDEMGKLCHAFEKMKDCLSKNNETDFTKGACYYVAFLYSQRLSITRRNIRRNISNVKKYFTS